MSKTKIVPIRLSETEYAALKTEADNRRVSVSWLIRDRVFPAKPDVIHSDTKISGWKHRAKPGELLKE